MDWGLVGSALFGGAAGMGEAGLEEIKQEREVARQEGIIRLQAEMNMAMADNTFENQKTLSDEMWEKTRTAAGEDYTRDRTDTVADREDLQAFQMGLIGESAKYRQGAGTPAKIQELEWYKANGYPLPGSSSNGLRPSDKVGLIKAYSAARENGDTELPFNDWTAEMGVDIGGGGTAAPAPTFNPNSFINNAMAKRKQLTDAATAKKPDLSTTSSKNKLQSGH